MFQFLCLFIFIFWVPYTVGLTYLGPIGLNITPTEFGIYFLFSVVLFSNIHNSSDQWHTTWKKFPIAPFVLFILGVFIAFFVGIFELNAIARSIYRVRALCVYPALMFFLFMYLIDTKEKAETLLWVFLTSATLLGLIILFGKSVLETVTVTEWAQYSGRLSAKIYFPGLGVLQIHPTLAGALFSIILSISFTFWLNAYSKKKRYFSACIAFICSAILIQSQARGGIFASIFSAAAICYLSVKDRLALGMLKVMKLSFVLMIILGLSYYMVTISGSKTFRSRGLEMFSNPFKAETIINRTRILEETIPIIVKHPFGIGAYGLVGAGNPLMPHNYYGDIWATHNFILFSLLYSGVIGTIGFLLIFVRFIKGCVNRLCSKDPIIRILSITGIGISISFFTSGITSAVLYDSWDVCILWVPIGIIMAAINLPDQRLEVTTKE